MPDIVQAVRAEVSAAVAYSTTPLSEGVGAGQYLMDLATQLDDGRPKDVCCEVPEEAFHNDVETVDISMFGTTSLLCFAKLVENVQVSTVVKVLYTWKKPHVGHIVVLGPDKFQLCTCLQILRTGLPCRHVLAVLMKLDCTAEFSGTSLHPRWRRDSEKWSIANAGLRAFDGEGLGPCVGGFTDDLQGMDFGDCHDDVAPKVAISTIRGRYFANMSETVTRSCKILVDNAEAKDSYILRRGQELVDRFHRDVLALVEAGDGPADPHHTTAGIRDPPIRPSKSRRETRIKDCLEGRSNKKGKY